MKGRNLLRIIAIATISILFSCMNEKKAKEPEGIGLYTFNILKNLNRISEAEFPGYRTISSCGL